MEQTPQPMNVVTNIGGGGSGPLGKVAAVLTIFSIIGGGIMRYTPLGAALYIRAIGGVARLPGEDEKPKRVMGPVKDFLDDAEDKAASAAKAVIAPVKKAVVEAEERVEEDVEAAVKKLGLSPGQREERRAKDDERRAREEEDQRATLLVQAGALKMLADPSWPLAILRARVMQAQHAKDMETAPNRLCPRCRTAIQLEANRMALKQCPRCRRSWKPSNWLPIPANPYTR